MEEDGEGLSLPLLRPQEQGQYTGTGTGVACRYCAHLRARPSLRPAASNLALSLSPAARGHCAHLRARPLPGGH